MTLLTLALLAGQDTGVEPSALPIETEGFGLAAKYPNDAGIDKDPRTVLCENFESGELKHWTQTDRVELVSDVTHTGSKGLKITATPGKTTGGHLYMMLNPGYDRLFLRLYVRFPEGHGYVHHFVNLSGYNPSSPWPNPQAGLRPRGDDRFYSGLDITGDWGRLPPPGRWVPYTYWCDMKGAPDGKFWGNAPKQEKNVVVATGRWICAELMVKCNTVGQADGEQAYWIDGTCVGRWGGYRWRTDPSLRVNAVWLLYYVTEKAGRPSHVHFDDVVVAQEYIGPMKKNGKDAK